MLIVWLQDNVLQIGTVDNILQITILLDAAMDFAHAVLDFQDIHQALLVIAMVLLHGLTEFPAVAMVQPMILVHALPTVIVSLDFVIVAFALSLQQ